MNRLVVKLLVLPILKRWCERTVWVVQWPADPGAQDVTYRFFKHGDTARAYAQFVEGAIVYPSKLPEDDPRYIEMQVPGGVDWPVAAVNRAVAAENARRIVAATDRPVHDYNEPDEMNYDL